MKAQSLFLAGTALLGLSTSATADEPLVLSGTVRDAADQPVGEILVHATSAPAAGGGGDAVRVETRTGADGSFSVAVPDASAPWTVVVDEAELLERGYFCVPGFEWEPGGPVDIPGLTAVPLRPNLSLLRTREGVTCLELDFDWLPGITPEILRQYRIERSTDMVTWTEVLTVSLACPPMNLFDETQRRAKAGFYRATAVESVLVGTLSPEDFEFIADPSLGWEGDPVLVFDPEQPLRQVVRLTQPTGDAFEVPVTETLIAEDRPI